MERIEPYMKIESHRDSVNCVLFNSNDTLLATSDMSGYIIITEVESKIQRCKASFFFKFWFLFKIIFRLTIAMKLSGFCGILRRIFYLVATGRA